MIYDNGSSDTTLEIARSYDNVRLYQGEFFGFGKTKNHAVSLAKNAWVYVIDSDESLTPELEQEAEAAITKTDIQGYRVPRLNRFFGKYIKHCGLYPDYSIRLYRKDFGSFDEVPVHEKVCINGNVGTLKHHMLHEAYESVEQFIAKQNRYSSLNKKSNFFKAVLNPFWTFFKIYFLKLGFLEGKHGFIIAVLYAQYTFWKYVK